MRLVDLIERLQALQIQLRADGGTLRVSAPRGALDAELRHQLAQRKGEILALLEEAEAAARPAPPPLRALPRTGPLPLSFSQRRLWFIDQLEPGSTAYNVPGALRLRGTLNVPALEGALREIVKRHEVLRTSFPAVDGAPVQSIAPAAPFVIPRIDLAALPAPAAEAERLALQEARRTFDLERGPVWRLALLRLGETEHTLLLTLHHIASDGWSISLFVRELTVLYEAFCHGLRVPLLPLPVQYADFAAWQQEGLRAGGLEAEAAWWRERLAGASPEIRIAPDHRGSVQSQTGALEELPLSSSLSGALADLARRRQVSRFILLLAAFYALLHRVTGEEDFSLGSPFAGRTRPELEELIGFFVNTLVLRAVCGAETRFSELLEQVRDTVLAAHAHQDLPFERLVEELQPERSLDRSPLFQVLFAAEDAPRATLEVAGLHLEPAATGLPASKVDLAFAATLEEGVEILSLTYRPSLYSAVTARRLLAHYGALLEAVATDPEARLSDLPLLSAAERHQAVAEWNDTARTYPEDLPVHRLFEEQAAARPEAVALRFRDETVTYRELNARANRLAHFLWNLGVGTEDRVAFCLERAPEALVTLLGILKAGGAYVPLDPDLPPERLSLLLADSRARVLLTDETSAGRLPPLPPEVLVVRRDLVAEAIDRQSSADLPCETGGDHLAYVMYTSGSTGRPKGVAVVHRGISRLVLAGGFARFGPQEVFLQLAPLSFDASTLEIWGALLHGSPLVLAPERLLSPARLGELLERYGVTFLWLTAGLFHQMVEEAVDGLRPVRQLLAGGDVVSAAHVRHLLAAVPGCRFIDGYGPTEGTTFTCCHPVAAGEPLDDSLPIGRPIGTTQAYVLDSALRPVAVGWQGELCAGGDGLARGYLDRPDLTAERFVPDAVSGRSGARLYRTGDLVRLRGDGAVDFVGRLDQQVKIRGFRIEPGEIEALLAAHPAVREGAVVVQEVRGERRLSACVVPRAPEDPAGLSATLREYLRSRLPDVMVPPSWTVLDALPLTPNGKVDRRALAQLAPLEETAAGGPPRTPTEELVAAVWSTLLGRERIGRDDSFFDLGGHSLLATRLLSRLRGMFGVELPLRRLFEAPTVGALARALDEMRGSSTVAPIAPVPRNADGIPLSFAQERLWFLSQLDPGSPAYNVPLALRLQGRLVPAALAGALGEVAKRHEVLRTRFVSRDGRPLQVIEAERRPELPVIDLAGLPEVWRDSLALRLATEEALRPFDLERGPLLRLALLRLQDGEHLLLLNLHHILTDGWSMGILVGEMQTLYGAFLRRESAPLPALPVQYADFAVWQRSWLEGEVLDAQLAYWKRQLEAAPRFLELPADRPWPAVRTGRGAARSLDLTSALSTAIRELCRREGVTPFMALLAAWGVVLGRHAGQEDVLVGTPVAGRNRPEVEDLIGFFVNTLVLRVDLSEAPTFGALLSRVRSMALDAFQHQDLPFERLVEELVPERALAHPPLVQVLFALQNAPVPDLELPGLSLAPVAMHSGVAKLDLSLIFQEGAEGFGGVLEHSTDLFDGSTAERFLARFEVLLSAVTLDPARCVADLPLLRPSERQQALVEWNDTRSGYPREACLPELFEEVVAEHADAPAMVSGGEVWSYRRLDEEANRLARRLRSLGVGPETAVGLCLERSPELILGTLAILKAGGLYVPLDAGYPDDRLDFMLADSGAEIVLVHETTRARMEGRRARLFSVDVAAEGPTPEDASPPGFQRPFERVPAESLAYVIYTSGSTGRPKGVAVPHRAIVRLVRDTNYVRLGPGDRTGQVANISFDAATYEIWGALLNGAAVAIIPRDVVLSPADFARRLREWRVTSMFLTSALFTKMSREEPEAFAEMSELLVGGEAVDPAAARTVLAGRPPRRLLNGYGPTESTTFAAWHPIREVAPESVNVPIGLPLGNTVLYVLDRRPALVPPGVAGELCIGGDGLARGYLNRPELTAERFIPDPWGSGGRLYRTGDLVRQRADGPIEFLGRLDNQVKIRGFRIEPGETEAVLAGHPEVHECAVLALREPAGAGETRLVAYVAGTARGEALRAWLQERLPDYMIPGAFVVLDTLPLTPNGKVDRRAVASLGIAPEQEGGSHAAPVDPVEQLLAGFWAEVLRLDRVGLYDDFFALGGHSLLATQVMSRIRSVLGVELPLRELFERPTVAALAQAVREARQDEQAPPIVAVPRDGAPPLSFAQQRLWFLDQLEPGNPAYNVPLPVRLTGEIRVDLLERVFTEVVRRHETLRTTFEEREGGPVQVIAPESRPALPFLDLSHLDEEERETRARELAEEDALRPFDLRSGPLLRLALLRLAPDDHVLLINLHHVISDGWSTGVLLKEISVLFEAFGEDRPSPLPELPVQYADFSLWQRGWLRGDVLERQLSYWKSWLADAPAALELPTDRARPAAQTYGGAVRELTLPPALSAGLRDLCRREGVTPFMALLAAWAVLLGRHASQDDVLVGSPVAGRNRREIEDLIGFFVNTLVLRVDLSPGLGFGGLLGQVRQTSLDAFAHQDLPFERLVEELAAERDVSRSPLFQVMFVLQNAGGQDVAIPGLVLAPVALEERLAKLDLTLTVQEAAEGFAAGLAYNTDLFDRTTAERLLTRFAVLLEAAVEAPDRRLTDLPLLLPAELQQVLRDWNDAGEPPAVEHCLHELFAAQAARTPEAVALLHGTDRLTYAELAGRAGGVARRLLALGIRPEVRVAVCLERSPDLIVSLLGVLAAGGAYVPVDPAYPVERRALMLEDSGAAVLVTRGRLAADLPATGAQVFDLDAEEVPPAALPVSAVLPEHLAYLIYTSGSTGRPKAVAIAHRSAVALAGWAREVFPAEELAGVLAATSVCFDLSVFEIFVPLAWGGRVLLAENALELPSLPYASEVRLLNTVPSAAAELVRGGGLPASVRTVNLAGEPLPAALTARLYATGTVRRVLNLYGPSEDTTYSTGSTVRESEQAPAIGRPLPGTLAHVVDRQGLPAPIGVAGELWLAGAGLARGYLGRPELTAERFAPNPFATRPGERVYRTGDLARFRPDGELEFLGRIDHQVKVRGFRIELGEVEAALVSHPAVEDCVCVVRDAALVAYCAGAPDLAELRASLARRLPDYMVPSVFVLLAALPRTPNGKLDRKALPAPERGRAEGGATYVAPFDPVEQLLAGFWMEVLRLDRIGPHDNFFALGGHSLLATQVMSRIREVIGVELPLRTLFEQPTVTALAGAVRGAHSRSGQAPALLAVPRGAGELPLSFAQQRLWLLDQLDPGTPAYNMPLPMRLTGRLRIDLLERVFAEVVRRHEALRTTFETRDSEPVQLIASPSRPALPLLDLSQLPEDGREARARELAKEDALWSFDLERGPLLRLTLLRLTQDDHILLLTMHHIVSDGWSMGVLLREIVVLYTAFAEGSPSPLPELPVQYADFAVWQRGWLQGEVLETQIAYWRRQLEGAPKFLELPADRPRPAVQTFQGASRDLHLGPALTAAVRELCRREGVTPFMALLAAWGVLLGRHAGMEDVLIGIPIAGRTRREIEDLIGFFVNTLVLRIEWKGQAGASTFGTLLGRVRASSLDAFQHQDLPFERIVEELVPDRDLAVPPLVQVLFVLQNAPRPDAELPGLHLSEVAVEARVARLDLMLTVEEGAEGFTAALEHSTDLFDSSTAERLLARFQMLLEAAVEDPGRPVTHLPLLLPAERRQILEDWNKTGEAPVSGVCLHELFAAQVARTPEAVALVHRTGRWTYAELAARAGGVARRLLGWGIEPEARVAVCLERSPDLIATLLGVLAAGGAYVPVDPAYPAERRALMLEDSGAAVLVTRGRLSADLPVTGARVLDLDAEKIASADGLPVGVPVLPEHLAYLIYTSGSTGRPKAVAIEHRSAVALAGWARETFSAEDLAGVLAATSVCFDLSVFEIFTPLAWGGRILLAENALELPSLSYASEVRVLNAVPSAAAELVRTGGIPPSVRTVSLAGEPLPAVLADRLYATGTVERVLNLYGPSEDTTYSTGSLVERESGRAPAIGRPLPGTRAYVVDREGQPAPAGVAGELWLTGAGLARGYLGRPELTAERFAPDPFASRPGERVYRTGDLVRFRPDGELEFLGRIDHQVKVRGFRIELGEVEAALVSHPAVEDCVCVVRDSTLVAYLAGAPDLNELRAWLGRSLPEYMVPSLFVLLDALPRTPNGKVDRKALPAVESSRGGGEDSAAPFGPAEELLAGIWSEVLGVENIARHESFFALGGHSLLATRVVSRLREVLGVELPLRRLFEAPTLERLAREVEDARRGEGLASAPPIVPVRHQVQDLPLSFAQQRLWFLDQLAPGNPAYNIPLAVQLIGVLRRSALEAAFHEVVRRHEALRTSFLSVSGQPVQRIADQAAVPLPLIDLETLEKPAQEIELRRLVRAETLRAFDLAAGPLFRTTLVRLEACRHAVLVTMHHVVSDGWSLGVLLGELGALYGAFSEGRPSPLPELVVQYVDYALWQRTWLSGERLDAEIAWWKHKLAGVPVHLELPADRPRPPRQSFRGGAWPVSLAPESRNALVSLGRDAGATPFMVILALFQALLARWSGQEDFLVGTPIAGRTRAETEPLIGFFVNTLALRSDLAGEPSLRVLLGRVREAALDAYAHQEIPFERLVEEIQPDRDLGRPALVQTLLALQNTPVTAAQVSELTFLPLEEEGETAKLDLSLHLSEQEDWIRGRFTYSTDLFEAATVARLAERFQRLLDGAVTGPDRRLSEVPLLSPAEGHQLVVESGGAPAPAPTDERCIHDLFAEQARKSPGAPAVLGEDGELTYAELGRRVRRLSLLLRAAGVGPDQPVILQAERGVGLVVGLLGILDAGGAYLAVDPDLPQARLELLAGDSRAILAVTRRGLSDTLPGGLRRIFLEDLEEEGPDLSELSPELPRAAVLPGHLAYVLYTSGSTGRPKGVMVEHRQLAAYVRGAVERLAPPDGASFASVSSFAADLGNTSIFAALLGGGCLHVVPRERLADAAAMADWMEHHPVDGLKIVPSHLAALLTAERPERLLPRRRLVLGGEALPWNLVERVRSLAPDCRVFNHYGPTETTVGVVAGEAGKAGSGPSVPLGRPLGQTRAWVVDRRLQLVPFGVPGELYIGGPQVTRGYLGRPDLTAERFIPDPFSGGAGARLYRTGDMVRQRGEGIEFLGRTDDQVKIRGFRIELPEIESTLLALPGVREAAALVRQKGDDRSLYAFVAMEPGAPEDAAALLARLRAQLPAALVPSVLAFVETLPRTSNGKIDRQALASVQAGSPVSESLPTAGDAADIDPVTRIIAAIWEEVLGLPRVGPHDDFFAIGGHSLLATRVCSRIREACAVELPLRALFEAGTPERLAAVVREARRGAAGRLEPAEPPEPPIIPVPRVQDFPLSFAQQRLWLLAQIEPDSPAYNVPMAVRLLGPLDGPALVAALRSVEQRHEVLRTTFTLVEGRPVQRPGMGPGLEVPVVDLQALPTKTRQEELARLARAEALRPFDLAAGPVWRATLVKLAEQEHGLFVTLHHIASDGWSRGILLREIGALYNSESALPALPVQYADFAVWQRGWLTEDVLRDQLDYWRRQLSGAPRALELPLDRPRPAVRTFRGAMGSVVLSPELSRKLTELCHQVGATPFMGLLASWAVVLGRHANQQDVLVGSPIAGRRRREVEGLIGCFINTLVLRTEFSGAPDFLTLLGRVRAMALDAYSHQDLPFERLVEELVTERDMTVTPLFQTLFVLQNTPAAAFLSPGLSIEPVEVEGSVPKFDLSLALAETPDAIQGSLEYDTDLFDASTMQRLLARWAALLEEAVAHPSVVVTDLPLLLPAERRQILEDWNDTGAAPLSGPCLHALFAAQAARTPEAVALIHESGQWTYAELAARAGGVARRMLDLGIRPEARVAVCLERSPDLIATLLGVLASGGAYVPIDPAYPVERRALMLEDSGAAVLVTRGRLSADLPETGARVLDLDVEPIQASDGLPLAPVLPENLAYLIYTSGSTGRPKAVAIEHRSAVALAGWARETFSADDLAGVLAATSVCFDLSVFEIFTPLAWGGRILLAENALELPTLPCASEVRLLNTVPSAAAELVRAGTLPASVRTVNLAGEPLPAVLADRLYATGTVERVLNLYGPSEDTTYSTGALVARRSDRMPPIGRPLPGTRAYVVDREGQPVPPGVAGELWLAGAGLARGYLGRPELTAERFTPDPFAIRPGERVYRTGDLVRFRGDGELEFLGRIDHQVKVRGFRIELGEVEAALVSHPAVEDCVCVVRDSALVAYLAGTVEADDLRAFLGRRLPEYMVPSVFVLLDALPRTPNGKVDRKALPAPEQTRRETAFEPPQDEVELRLARIWENLLGVGRVGRRESFFALGGHSLLAIRVLGAIERDFGRQLPLAALMQAPTIERLAALIRQGASPSRSLLVPLRPGSGTPLFLVHPVGGNVFCYLPLASHLEDRPLYGIQAPDFGALPEPRTIEAMAALYVEALREVQPVGPYRLAGWSLGGVVAYEMARQLEAEGREVTLLAMIDVSRPRTDSEELDPRLELAWFVHDLRGLTGLSGPGPVQLPADTLDALLEMEEVRAMLPPEIGLGQLRELFALFRANLRALTTYRPCPYGGRLTLVRAVETAAALPADTDQSWSALATGGAEIHLLPGDHYALLTPAGAAAVADLLGSGS
jgi:amino acid adenylation domain-containing protein